MSKERKVKTLHYRHAQFINSTRTLEDLLSSALSINSLVGNRREDVTGDEDYRLINHTTNHRGVFCGNFLSYERGTNKLFLTENNNAKAYTVQQIAPPTLPSKERTEFLDSILYFGIKGNHVILMQSSGLKSKQFEQYLNWLLSACGAITNNNRVELVDHPSAIKQSQLSNQPVKKIHYALPIALEAAVPDTSSNSKTKNKTLKMTPVGKAVDILKACLGVDEYEKLRLENALDGNLQVSLEVTYQRTTTEAGQRALNNIARALRHMDGEDISVHVPGLGVLEGNQLKLSKPVQVTTHDGIVDQAELFDEMHQWLLGLVKGDFIHDDKQNLTDVPHPKIRVIPSTS